MNRISTFDPDSYYYPKESGFYYLLSRYYDPEIGRFINADSFASTGQGFVGYNMFAYCLNNPVAYSDTSGETAVVRIRDTYHLMQGEASGSGGGTPIVVGALAAISTIAEMALSAASEIYAYSKSISDSLAEESKKSQPQVHHIVPKGAFSNRSGSISIMVAEMQQILLGVGIDVRTAPENLMLVSQGTHSALHTDTYIIWVYSVIKPAAGKRDAVLEALFWLRLGISAIDAFSIGY